MSETFPAPDGSPLAQLESLVWPELEIAGVEAILLRDESVSPVRGAVGTMRYRPGLLVRVTDRAGLQGYGEIWVNFPVGGSEYKAALVREYVAPLLAGRRLKHPSEGFEFLERHLRLLALQSGDHGAFAQSCAGVDQALWDLFSKRAEAPLWKLAGGSPTVEVYASGIGPDDVADTILQQAEAGHTRFKIKLGFGEIVDRRNLEQALRVMPPDGVLMTDANQAWPIGEAERWMLLLESLGIVWCEEPIAADSSCAEWGRLADRVIRMRLAAGENLRGLPALSRIASEGGVRVLQPDLGKWGGITGALRLHSMLASDVWLCPHWLSGAVGQVASLQLTGAIGSGWVEVDSNPNRLRSDMLEHPLVVAGGTIRLGEQAGLIPRISDSFIAAEHRG